MLPTWVVSLLQAGRITHFTAIIETPGNTDWGGGVQLKNRQGTGEESKGKCQGVELIGKVVP